MTCKRGDAVEEAVAAELYWKHEVPGPTSRHNSGGMIAFSKWEFIQTRLLCQGFATIIGEYGDS
jgi:hypothetical protein